MRARPSSSASSRIGLALVAASLLAAVAGALLGGSVGAGLFAAGAVGLPLGLLAAGAPAGGRRLSWLGWGSAALPVVAAVAVISVPEWSRRTVAGGWPAGALAALLGLWLLPLLLLGLATALAPPAAEGPEDEGGPGAGEGDRDARR